MSRPTPRAALVALSVALALGLTAWHAQSFAFLCDDAFISFRYARNLVEGHGLVFNVGDRVEGYTNFLWTVSLAGLLRLGILPEDAAIPLGFVFTAGTLAVLGGLAWTSPSRDRDLGLVVTAWLVATHRSFAVWSSSGLETRMFTFLVLAGLLALRQGSGRRSGLALGSSLFALSALCRPEALLFGPLALGWAAVRDGRQGPRLPVLLAAFGPFVAGICAHTAFRLGYYGAWLPNTFAAKGSEVWWEAGRTYLAGAAVEHGVWVLGPLAVIGGIARARRGDGLHALSAMLVLPHLVYLARIGGDHFEYRMLDVAFCLLLLAASDGVLAVAAAAGRARFAAAFALALLGIGAQGLIPWLDARATEGQTRRQVAMHTDLTADHGPWLFALPGVPALVGTHNELRTWAAPRLVATRHVEHRNFWQRQVAWFAPYADIPRDRFPRHVTVMEGAMGIFPYYLADLTVIDAYGLTDATVARSPVRVIPDDQRRLAHVKRDIADYVERRTNATVRHATTTPEEALTLGAWAVELGPDLWLPYDGVPGLIPGFPYLGGMPVREGDVLRVDGGWWQVTRLVEGFEGRMPGWTVTGDAFADNPSRAARDGQGPVEGQLGRGWVNSFHPRIGDRAKGTLRSPPIPLAGREQIVALVGGGDVDGVGVRVLDGEVPGASARGPGAERFTVRVLRAGRGPRTLTVEVFDHADGPWGHVLLDQLAVVVPVHPSR